MRRKILMGTGLYTGTGFSVSEHGINLFQKKGVHYSNGNWGVDDFDGNDWMELEPNTRVSEQIDRAFGLDEANGVDNRISMLILNASKAVLLYLEGILAAAHFERAVEERGFIEVPNVEIHGRVLTVRIYESSEHAVATADSEGNIL
jgi:hypothetical protein